MPRASGLRRPSLSLLPPFDEKRRALVVIETTKGSANKLKYEPAYGAFRLTQVLPVGMSFPFDFGFLPCTKAPDGHPLDALVLMRDPVPAGCIVPSRLVGVIEAEQREPGGRWRRNDRLIAVADCEPTQAGIRTITDLSPVLLKQIESFFADYNRVAGKGFRIVARRGRQRARRLAMLARDGSAPNS